MAAGHIMSNGTVTVSRESSQPETFEQALSQPTTAELSLMISVLNFFTDYFWMSACAVGLVGNSLSFLISLLKENRRFSTCVYMAGLAVVDNLMLVAILVIFPQLFWVTDPVSELQFQCIYYVAYSTAILSGLFLTLMSIDRLIVVRFPLAAKQKCTPSKAVRVVAVCIVVVLVLDLHIFFVYKQTVPEGERVFYLDTDIPGYPELETLVQMYHLIFGSVAPFIIIVFCNLWIIVTLQYASSKRKEMGVAKDVAKTQGKETRHLTRMLILVCLAFIVTSVPYRLYTLITSIPAVSDIYKFHIRYWEVRYFMQNYIVLDIWHWNYAINFYLYCIGGGKKYRADVRKLFKCQQK